VAKPAEAEPADEPTAEELAAVRNKKANCLDRIMAGAYLEATLGEASTTDPDAIVYVHLSEKILKEAGDPVDPIERMAVEMTALAYHKTGQLMAKAARAEHLHAIEIYNAAAAKMMGEFRRQLLALKEYRATAGSPKLKVVGGQGDESSTKGKCTA